MSAAEKSRKNSNLDDLEEMRLAILDEMLIEAAFDGWTESTLVASAKAAGMDSVAYERGDLKRAFPKGIADVLDFWSEREDEKMVAAFEAADPAPAKIRDKVRFLVRTRIEGLSEHREAARRASATLALPYYMPLASRLAWRTADAVWRALGDSSTDFNFYTKRTTLSGVYLSTLAAWFGDEDDEIAQPAYDKTPPYEKTWRFLDERIENVMQFEKLKKQAQDHMPDLSAFTGFLGRMRYGPGDKPQK